MYLILHRSWRYAAAAMLAGIRFRSGYGIGSQQKFLNDSVALDPAMKKVHPRESVAAFAAKKGIVVADPHPRITPTADAAAKASRLGDAKKPLIICGVGAADAARRWSPEHFAGMIDRLAAVHPDYQLALCGSPAEAGIGDAIIAALDGKTPHPLRVFDQLSMLLSPCISVRCFISAMQASSIWRLRWVHLRSVSLPVTCRCWTHR